MFSRVQGAYQANKIVTGVTGLSAAAGVTYGLVKHKSFWGVVAFAAGFGLAGYLASAGIVKLTSKS